MKHQATERTAASLLASLVCAGVACSLTATLLPVPAIAAEADVPDVDSGDTPGAEPAEPAEPISLTDARVSTAKRVTYSGSKKKPAIKVTLGGKKLKAGTDYTVRYSNNRKVGKATAAVTGKGLYTGKLKKTFKIVPRKAKKLKAKVVGGSVLVSWKPAKKQTSGYRLYWSTSRKFAKKKTHKKLLTKRSAHKLELRGLAVGKRYYFKVAAFKKVKSKRYWSAQSKRRSAKIARQSKDDLLKLLSKASSSKSVKTFNSTYKLGKTKAGKSLLRTVSDLRKRYKINFEMIDIQTGEGLSCSPHRYMYSASCLKGPFVASLNRWKPYSRRSAGTMRSTIVWSDNNTYSALRSSYGSSTMSKLMRYSDVHSFDPYRKYAYLPTSDLAKLWVGTYWYFYKSTNANSTWCRNLYTHGYNSFIYQGMKTRGKKVHAKPGWFPGGGYNVQNDAGVVMAKVGGKSRPYIVSVMTSACGQYAKLRELVRAIDDVHTDMCR